MFDFFDSIESEKFAVNHALNILHGCDDDAIDEFCRLQDEALEDEIAEYEEPEALDIVFGSVFDY